MNKSLVANIFLAFGITSSLLPYAAFADPKSDINAYEAELENGNAKNALNLMELALKNAKNLQPSNPYLARIAYDNAYFYTLYGDYPKANSAVEIIDKSLTANPTLIQNAQLGEYKFLRALIKFSIIENDDTAKQLNNAVNSIDNSKREDDLAFEANYKLGQFYLKNKLWNDLGETAQRQIDYFATNKSIDQNSARLYKVNAYLNRAQVKFIKQLQPLTVKVKLDSVVKQRVPVWADALSDVVLAEKAYGKMQTQYEPLANELDGWYGIINAYARQRELPVSKQKYIDIVHQNVNFKGNEFFPDNDQQYCFNKIIPGIKISYDYFYKHKIPYAYSRLMYDIDAGNRITNVRVINSYPEADFGPIVAHEITGTKIKKIDTDTPKECLKNKLIRITYVVK